MVIKFNKQPGEEPASNEFRGGHGENGEEGEAPVDVGHLQPEEGVLLLLVGEEACQEGGDSWPQKIRIILKSKKNQDIRISTIQSNIGLSKLAWWIDYLPIVSNFIKKFLYHIVVLIFKLVLQKIVCRFDSKDTLAFIRSSKTQKTRKLYAKVKKEECQIECMF